MSDGLAIGILLGLLALQTVAVGVYLYAGRKPRHKHEWEILSAEMGISSFLGRFDQPVTLVYWRCKGCGKTELEEKKGHWTEKELGIR